MVNLSAQLEAMDIPQLLETLQAKLDGVTSIVRAYPEARLTLAFTLSLLRQINNPTSDPGDLQPTSKESIISSQLQQNQQLTTTLPLHIHEINQMLASDRESNR